MSDQLNMFAEADAKVAENNRKRATQKYIDSILPVTPARKESIEKVYEVWKREYEYKRAKLTDSRKIAINARLYSGFKEEELIQVLMFVKDLPFWRGQNDRNKPFDDLDVLFANNERTERLLVQARNGRKEVDRRATHLAANDDPTTTENF